MSTVQIVVTISVFLGGCWCIPVMLGGYANAIERVSIFLYHHAMEVRERQRVRAKVLRGMWVAGKLGKSKSALVSIRKQA